jgi:hypothetical protein
MGRARRTGEVTELSAEGGQEEGTDAVKRKKEKAVTD